MLKRKRIDSYSDEEILQELKRVAEIFQNEPFSRPDYDRHALKCKGTTVLSRFKSWKNALSLIGINKNITPKEWKIISDEELFLEMNRIFLILGQRPSKNEWDSSNPKYSYTTYKRRFGGWVRAFECFLQWMEKNGISIKDSEPHKVEYIDTFNTKSLKIEKNRHIPLKNRLEVLKRDQYRCVLCGASPAKDGSVSLHVDHIKPYSKGGTNETSNLQTLCEKCNWGKGSN